MSRSTLIALALAGAPCIALPVLSLAAPGQGSKPTTAQKARKAEDSPKTKQAKATQRLKAAQSPNTKSLTGTWAIDPNHSMIGFGVQHVLINDVQGTFDEFEGTIKADGSDPAKSGVEFKAKVASINTRQPQRDAHLKSPDFFDAAKYPDLTFKSTRVERTDDDRFRMVGLLTMHGVTKSISFPFKLRGPVTDGFGFTRIGIQADLQLNRQDYGVKWNQVLDNGGLAVSNIVAVRLNLEAVKAGTGPKK